MALHCGARGRYRPDVIQHQHIVDKQNDMMINLKKQNKLILTQIKTHLFLRTSPHTHTHRYRGSKSPSAVSLECSPINPCLNFFVLNISNILNERKNLASKTDLPTT